MGTQLDKAIKFATEAHSGAFRTGTTIPYIVHPLEALSIAATLTDDEDILAATVLHDVLEDTGTVFVKLVMEFGVRIATLVASESEKEYVNFGTHGRHVEVLATPNSKNWVFEDEVSGNIMVVPDTDIRPFYDAITGQDNS